jgi:hypothetical protein
MTESRFIDREHHRQTDVDPEHSAGQAFGDFFRRQQRVAEAVRGGIHEEQTKSGHHRDQAEIARREQAAEDHGSRDLDDQ